MGLVTTTDGSIGNIVGSCQCDCPPDQGFGTCFNVDEDSAPPIPEAWDRRDSCHRIAQNKSSSLVGILLSHAENLCPRLGAVLPCNRSTDSGLVAGTKLCREMTRNNGSVLLKECADVPGTGRTTLTCDSPVKWNGAPKEFGPCIWREAPCQANPYY